MFTDEQVSAAQSALANYTPIHIPAYVILAALEDAAKLHPKNSEFLETLRRVKDCITDLQELLSCHRALGLVGTSRREKRDKFRLLHTYAPADAHRELAFVFNMTPSDDELLAIHEAVETAVKNMRPPD